MYFGSHSLNLAAYVKQILKKKTFFLKHNGAKYSRVA